jgi:hypothetical protein
MFYFSCLWVFGVAGKSSIFEAAISQNAARRRRRHGPTKEPRGLKNLHRQHNQSKSIKKIHTSAEAWRIHKSGLTAKSSIAWPFFRSILSYW